MKGCGQMLPGVNTGKGRHGNGDTEKCIITN